MNGPILQLPVVRACSNLATYSDWVFVIISFRFLETVLASTFDLFSTSSDPDFGSSELQFMTPLHFLALVDPRATWFKKWMVSLNSACLMQIEAQGYKEHQMMPRKSCTCMVAEDSMTIVWYYSIWNATKSTPLTCRCTVYPPNSNQSCTWHLKVNWRCQVSIPTNHDYLLPSMVITVEL